MKQNFGQPVEAKTAGVLQSSRKEDQALSSATNGFQNSMTWCTSLSCGSSDTAFVGELEFVAVFLSHGPVALLLFLLGPHIQP
jgi:hypothetical protein